MNIAQQLRKKYSKEIELYIQQQEKNNEAYFQETLKEIEERAKLGETQISKIYAGADTGIRKKFKDAGFITSESLGNNFIGILEIYW